MHMPCDPSVHLYVVAHKNVDLPNTDVLIPFRSDYCNGDHIGDREDYSELRAQYWVWRNENLSKDGYVGFFHYRRYLDFFDSRKNARSYRIQTAPDTTQYHGKELLDFFADTDVITSLPERSGITVRQRYEKSAGHRKSDLDLICEIIRKDFPEYAEAADRYLNGEYENYGNMYVMKNQLFNEYCQWLFTIEEMFDRQVREPLPRTNGYLGERLFGIWYTYRKMKPGFTYKEVPRVHFSCYDDETHRFRFARLMNRILPPGSFVRRCITQIYYSKKPVNK